MRVLATILTVLALASAAAAAPFADVPRTHWAYAAIQKAVDAKILQGVDGKFEGQRLLDRYQMAVVVAKLLDAMKTVAPADVVGGASEYAKNAANLEALTTEFADELAALKIKVSTLEDGLQELRGSVAASGAPAAAEATSGSGFTAFASFGLLNTDDYASSGAVDSPFLSDDSTYFDTLQLSLGIDRQVDGGVFFHAQFDFNAFVNDVLPGGVGINEAFFFVDEFFGDVGGKVGAFALPFSMEHVGPFRTCSYTITPSIANSFIERVRGYGVEFEKTKDVRPSDLTWKFGVLSGTDWSGIIGAGIYESIPLPLYLTTQEADDNFGYFAQVARKPNAKSALGWNLGYFDNGGDVNGTPGSPEISYLNLGLEWSNDDLTVLAQYMDIKATMSFDEDLPTWYLLVNWRLDTRQSVTLRYDHLTADADGVDEGTIHSWTFAFNRAVTANSMLQFEYIHPETEIMGNPDVDDDLYQLRYKVHF